MAKMRTGLPRHIRRFCDDELFAYRQVLADLAEAEIEREDILLEGGNLGFINPVGRVDGGLIGSSPTYRYAGRREALLNGPRVRALRRRAEKVQAVLATLDGDEQYIIRCYYYHGMKPEEITQATGWEEYLLFELRAYVMTALATEWGLI